MKRTRFTDEQIIGILAEHEAGAKCAEHLGRISGVQSIWTEIPIQKVKQTTAIPV